ncbi:hypothetical protein [Compostibacter hankyongensis]|uniref:Uncharacterized protein n=1 Tax=Compostibacter hankyongensis TaxID=1007089 RepID=A0ABP8FCD7_9BACT
MGIKKDSYRIMDMHTLELEKRRVRNLCRGMEREMEQRVDYLKDNYRSLAIHSIFPSAGKGETAFKWALKAGKIIGGLQRRRSRLLKTGVVSLLEVAAVKTGLNLVRRMIRKKRNARK